MRLAAKNGPAVELLVMGYEFPDNHTGEYDSNWLIIAGRVTDPRGDWSFRHPSLLTYEASRLGDWLEEVAAGQEGVPYASFIEPNLSFDVRVADEARLLIVTCGAEASPPWASEEDGPGYVEIELPIAEVDLRRAVASWRQQLAQFPQRAAE